VGDMGSGQLWEKGGRMGNPPQSIWAAAGPTCREIEVMEREEVATPSSGAGRNGERRRITCGYVRMGAFASR
jgi:hypothetical protein